MRLIWAQSAALVAKYPAGSIFIGISARPPCKLANLKTAASTWAVAVVAEQRV
jgi:hypothetical protein